MQSSLLLIIEPYCLHYPYPLSLPQYLKNRWIGGVLIGVPFTLIS